MVSLLASIFGGVAKRPRPLDAARLEVLARLALDTANAVGATQGRKPTRWEDLHPSNRVQYLAIARAVAEAVEGSR